MLAVDFVLLPKSGCYRLNKHPSLTFHWESIPKTVMIALEGSLWKVMQISHLAECSSQRHKVVAKTLNPRKVNLNHMFMFFFFSLIPGRLHLKLFRQAIKVLVISSTVLKELLKFAYKSDYITFLLVRLLLKQYFYVCSTECLEFFRLLFIWWVY